MEVALAGALDPAPPPLVDLGEPDVLPDLPADAGSVMALLPWADRYLQDEVRGALHPTRTRGWCRKGRRGQRLIEAPGQSEEVSGLGPVDWRDGWFGGRRAPGRTAAVFREQVRAAVARSRARGRVAIVGGDNASTHTPAGSKLVRRLVAEAGEHLRLVYTLAYDPDANRIAWPWRPVRRAVTHDHQRRELATLQADPEAEFRHLADYPRDVLAHPGSPGLELNDAAEPPAAAA